MSDRRVCVLALITVIGVIMESYNIWIQWMLNKIFQADILAQEPMQT